MRVLFEDWRTELFGRDMETKDSRRAKAEVTVTVPDAADPTQKLPVALMRTRTTVLDWHGYPVYEPKDTWEVIVGYDHAHDHDAALMRYGIKKLDAVNLEQVRRDVEAILERLEAQEGAAA